MWRKKTFILTYFPLCGGDLRLRCDCYCYGMDFFICSFILSLFMSFCLFFLSTSVSCCFFSEVLIKVFQQHLHFIFMSQIQRNILCTCHRSIQHPLVSYTEKKNHFCLFHKVAIWQKNVPSKTRDCTTKVWSERCPHKYAIPVFHYTYTDRVHVMIPSLCTHSVSCKCVCLRC